MSAIEKANGRFRTELTFGQAIAMVIPLLGVIIGAWITINYRMTVVEEQVKTFQMDRTDSKNFQEKVYDKLEDVQEEIGNLKVSMERKEDRQ